MPLLEVIQTKQVSASIRLSFEYQAGLIVQSGRKCSNACAGSSRA